MTDPKPTKPSGGMLTYWVDIRVVCLCGESVLWWGSGAGKTKILTCSNCGQQFRAVEHIEEIHDPEP